MPNGKASKILRRWRELQKREWQAYRAKGGQGVFSIPSHKTAVKVRRVVANHMHGLCLDVGCGCLPRPSYMPASVRFIGIDPFFGDRKRKFPFAQSIAETLPFCNETFDGVLFASSIDHLIQPGKGLAEAWRVLKPGGTLIVWYSRRGGKAYQEWKAKGGLYNPHHQWAWTDQTMRGLVGKHRFTIRGVNKMGHKNRVLVGIK